MAKKKVKPRELLSNCCGAAAENEIVDGLAICSRCKEWADFDDLEIEDTSINYSGL
jgi:hypothetical protein